MKNISKDALPILAEVCMELTNDPVQSLNDIRLIDDLLSLVKLKNLINNHKGRKSNREKRFHEIFEARIYASQKIEKKIS